MGCDCSIDHDNGPKVFDSSVIKARKDHRCIECREVIPPGAYYHRDKGLWEHGWDCYDTCLTCGRIREDYCSHGYTYGELGEAIQECLGFDYVTGETFEDDEYFDEIVARREAEALSTQERGE